MPTPRCDELAEGAQVEQVGRPARVLEGEGVRMAMAGKMEAREAASGEERAEVVCSGHLRVGGRARGNGERGGRGGEVGRKGWLCHLGSASRDSVE